MWTLFIKCIKNSLHNPNVWDLLNRPTKRYLDTIIIALCSVSVCFTQSSSLPSESAMQVVRKNRKEMRSGRKKKIISEASIPTVCEQVAKIYCLPRRLVAVGEGSKSDVKLVQFVVGKINQRELQT